MENNQANIQLEMNFDIPSGNRFRRCLENGLFTVLFEHAAPGLELPEAEAARRAEIRRQEEEAAQKVGRSRPAVANSLRLLGLCPEVLERLRKGDITAGHARAILTLKSAKKQIEAAQKIAALGLSVRQAELLCGNMTREPLPEKRITLAVDYVAECEKSLAKQLGRGVKIVNGKRKGRFELEFYGDEDLQNLLDALMNMKK